MSYKPFKNEETRTSVLAQIKTGSEAAWRRFFDIYAGYVYSLANKAGLINTDADEIVQAVFISLSVPGGFAGYDRSKGAFRSWLRKRTNWKIADAYRKRAKDRILPNGDFADTVSAEKNLDEGWVEIVHDEALRRLREKSSKEHFAIFQASVLEEIPTDEVVRLYNVSRDNVYQIRKRMSATLEGYIKEAFRDLDSPELPE